ncbi:hypothetical protein UFOVP1025_19 [uncultured Caudovirales phage]|uniref:Uncharacterized protein n=1 Tax=uncultured Caudovirales phage TaxID=2100421 RepID=A0A6J5Q104_9CAUD|nr:hypothetical protein UFOVP852_15 [uncultured Caudovirales phage]CAB4173224.1 hypothetical protein UFOVP948_38 [uncultured Caudovirales phage]CAB4178957.1 hypothetical protein UFOVP1025_19 [uncultured Caudovirales phage]CAB4219896.1 hypothetical protein UFOVP1628_22 [uncultured Caudovirales phage]
MLAWWSAGGLVLALVALVAGLLACRAGSLPVCQSAGGGFVLVCAYIC